MSISECVKLCYGPKGINALTSFHQQLASMQYVIRIWFQYSNSHTIKFKIFVYNFCLSWLDPFIHFCFMWHFRRNSWISVKVLEFPCPHETFLWLKIMEMQLNDVTQPECTKTFMRMESKFYMMTKEHEGKKETNQIFGIKVL